MTEYELYTMVERDYLKRGGEALERAMWWKRLSGLPLIGKFATKRAEALDAEADTYIKCSIIAWEKAWKLRNS